MLDNFGSATQCFLICFASMTWPLCLHISVELSCTFNEENVFLISTALTFLKKFCTSSLAKVQLRVCIVRNRSCTLHCAVGRKKNVDKTLNKWQKNIVWHFKSKQLDQFRSSSSTIVFQFFYVATSVMLTCHYTIGCTKIYSLLLGITNCFY